MKKIFCLFFAAITCNSLSFSQCSSSISPLSQSVNCNGGASPVSFTVSAISPTNNIRHDWYSPAMPLPNGVPVLSSTSAVSVLSGSFSPGVYTVITTDLGNLCQDSKTFAITSPSAMPTLSMLTTDYSVGCAPNVTLYFLPISTQTPPATCSFSFLPPTFTGVVTPSVNLGAGGSTVTNVTGTWTIVVQDNSNFCRAFLPVPIGTSSTIPSFNYTVGGAGLVFFQSTSTGTNGGTIFNWDFGDGSTGTGISTSHTYSNGGVHQVILSTNNPNCNMASSPVNVNTLPCTANSGYSIAYSGTPQIWNAAPNYFGNVTNVLWSWGDGNFDNTMFPTHTYSAAGFYNICLSVTVSCASSSSFCSNYNIYKSAEVTEEMTMVTVNVVPKLTTGLVSTTKQQDQISFYPNPASDFLNMTVIMQASEAQFNSLEIVNSIGQLVKRVELKVNNNNVALDIKELPPGVYQLIGKRESSPAFVNRFVISR